MRIAQRGKHAGSSRRRTPRAMASHTSAITSSAACGCSTRTKASRRRSWCHNSYKSRNAASLSRWAESTSNSVSTCLASVGIACYPKVAATRRTVHLIETAQRALHGRLRRVARAANANPASTTLARSLRVSPRDCAGGVSRVGRAGVTIPRRCKSAWCRYWRGRAFPVSRANPPRRPADAWQKSAATSAV